MEKIVKSNPFPDKAKPQDYHLHLFECSFQRIELASEGWDGGSEQARGG